jgi:hypothetical protein
MADPKDPKSSNTSIDLENILLESKIEKLERITKQIQQQEEESLKLNDIVQKGGDDLKNHLDFTAKMIEIEKDRVENLRKQLELEKELTDMSDDLDQYPTLLAMANYFELEDAKRRVHCQLPGQMFNLHIDKLWDRCPDNPERVVRITIMLEDWQPGQFYLYGTRLYSQWRAGEIHIFDWANVPHATANASRFPRPILQITGLATDRTMEIIKNSNINTVHQL